MSHSSQRSPSLIIFAVYGPTRRQLFEEDHLPRQGARASQFDEHLRLIAANNFDEAFLKARVLGINEEETLITDRNKTLKWEFINVAELIPLSELKDGSEIYSSIHETSEGNSYIHHVHQRAVQMQTKQRPLV